MKLALDTYSYHMHFGKHRFRPQNPVDIDWYCKKSKELGLDGLHIDPYHIDLEKDLDRIIRFAIENYMYIELGASGTDPQKLFPYIKAAEKADAKILRTFVGGSCLDSKKTAGERTALAKRQLKKSVKLAEAAGVKIAVENHGDIFMENLVDLMEIDSDNLGVCYDSGNFAFTGENPLEAVEVLGDRIICTHLKDVCEKQRYPEATPFETVNEPVHFCALGEGRLPIVKILEAILGKKPGMNITLEICSPMFMNMDEGFVLSEEEKNVVKSIGFMRKNFPL